MSFRFTFSEIIKIIILVMCFDSLNVLAIAPTNENEIKVRYLGQGSLEGEDKRNDYYVELLQTALARSRKYYTFEKGPRGLSGLRQLYAVANGTVDVGWSLSTEENEKVLAPIRIPIDKGLVGWRLLLINKDDTNLFENVKSVDDLRQIRLGHGQDWIDTSILRANQFNVEGVSTYEGIFKMLKQKRIRYFPRSIMEITAEIEAHKNLDLIIEPTLLIHYPAAIYFVVNPEKPSLAKDIESGLKAMIKDGAFNKLFEKYNAQSIKNANLNQRHLYKLHNPYLPKATPINQSELWFDVTQLQK